MNQAKLNDAAHFAISSYGSGLDIVAYSDLLAQAINAREQMDAARWIIGRIASLPIFADGEKTISELAKDIYLGRSSVSSYARVWRFAGVSLKDEFEGLCWSIFRIAAQWYDEQRSGELITRKADYDGARAFLRECADRDLTVDEAARFAAELGGKIEDGVEAQARALVDKLHKTLESSRYEKAREMPHYEGVRNAVEHWERELAYGS